MDFQNSNGTIGLICSKYNIYDCRSLDDFFFHIILVINLAILYKIFIYYYNIQNTMQSKKLSHINFKILYKIIIFK